MVDQLSDDSDHSLLSRLLFRFHNILAYISCLNLKKKQINLVSVLSSLSGHRLQFSLSFNNFIFYFNLGRKEYLHSI